LKTNSQKRSANDPADLDSAWHELERSGWLASCRTDVRSALRSIAVLKSFASGDYLYHVGDKSNGVFGIVSGALDSLIPRTDGEVIVVHRSASGTWIGDLAFYAGQVRLISLRAGTALTAVQLPQRKLTRLTGEKPELIADFYRLSYENMATTLALLGNLATPRAETRIARRLLILQHAKPGEWIELGQESLAELVALSSQSVRRALHSFEKRGLIELSYRKLRIIDMSGLAALCGEAER
jgi:CRP/FNR family cyclic AMP-dependent transcriptional regulator